MFKSFNDNRNKIFHYWWDKKLKSDKVPGGFSSVGF